MKKNIFAGILALALIFTVTMIGCKAKSEGQSDGASSSSSSSGGSMSASAALQAFQQTVDQRGKAVPDVEAILRAVQSMSSATLTQLTQQNGSPSGDFSYDLAADGKGIAIRDYTKRPADAVVIVPETIEGLPVTEIASREDTYSNLGRAIAVILPATITKIGDNAFNSDSLTSLAHINFPAGLKEIGKQAFYHTKLTNVSLPEGLETLGKGAFKYCDNLVSLTLPGSLKTIPDEAFYSILSSNLLTELVIPEGIETIGLGAFHGNKSLLKVTFPSTIKEIRISIMDNHGAFRGCSELTDIVIPDTLTSIRWIWWNDSEDKPADQNYFASLSKPPTTFEGCGKLKLAVRQRLKDLGYTGEF